MFKKIIFIQEDRTHYHIVIQWYLKFFLFIHSSFYIYLCKIIFFKNIIVRKVPIICKNKIACQEFIVVKTRHIMLKVNSSANNLYYLQQTTGYFKLILELKMEYKNDVLWCIYIIL